MEANILAYSTQQVDNKTVKLICSDGRNLIISDWSDLITELLYPCKFAVVYNLEKFIDDIIILFPKQTQADLKNGDKARSYLTNGEKIFYIPARMFSVTYAGKETNFYALHRYTDHAITEANELLDLAHRIIGAFKIFGIEVTKLTSPVAVYSEILDSLAFPRAKDLPDSARSLIDEASKTMWTEWRELFKIGHWEVDEVSDLDLCGAYSSIIANLPDITNATFFESDILPTDYSWGLLYGDLEVVRDVSPFQDNTEIHRKGLIKDQTITTDGLWLLNKYGGNFTLKHGRFFKLPKIITYPFKETMRNLYTIREHPNEMVADIAKQISIGIGGQLAQRYKNDKGGWKLGNNFNSIYAKMTTDRCSLKVADHIYRNSLDSSVISVTVDGLLHEGKSNVTTEKQFGKWRLNEPTPFLVVSVLNQWGGKRHPNMKYYDEMITEIKAHPKSAMIFDVDLHLVERDRIFEALPRNWGELMNSRFNSKPFGI